MPTADLTQRFGGTVVKSTGDGHLMTFDGPTQAIRCAEALRAEAERLASMPTPGARIAMRRSDCAVEVIAKRTPWILRGMGRLAAAADRR